MSYDFSGRIDTGGDEPLYIEPYFCDAHPAFSGDGMAGNVMVTETGYARCGNYTSNVSGMWAKCLTAALECVPEARPWCGDDARSFNATGRTVSRLGPGGEWLRGQQKLVDSERLCLRDLNGKRCGDLAPVLAVAVEWGVEHIDELHKDDPSNGWGDAEGAVTYLWDIQRFCEKHPKADLYISS